MSSQLIYALAQHQKQVGLVLGDSTTMKVGALCKRDPGVSGAEVWRVIKIYDSEQQELLDALGVVMGFSRLRRLFDFKVQ